MLRKWIEHPLISKDEIDERLDAVGAVRQNEISAEELREYLGPVYDLERLSARISMRTANPRDLISLRSSFSMLPHIHMLMKEFPCGLFGRMETEFDDLSDLTDLLNRAILDDPPLAMKEGGIIKDGYSEDVDNLRSAKSDGRRWLMELEAKEREETGIHTLKVKYNRVFGYCM